MAKKKTKSSLAATDAGPIDGVLDLGAQRAVAGVARPLALLVFIAAAALTVVAAVFRCDADWTPAWLVIACWSLAVWAEGGALRAGDAGA